MYKLASLLFSLLLFTSYLQAKSKEINFSMVISGGVSLGAYEAGYNWTMIKLLSGLKNTNPHIQPKLRSISGASAGSINATLTAMYWCQKETVPLHNSVTDNLFYETWVNLGIGSLMIKGKDPQNKSTLFTRKALKRKGQKIIRQMNQPIYKKGCQVPLGISVTKVTPVIESISGVKVKNQHFAIPLLIKEKNGKLVVENKTLHSVSESYISIPGIEKNKKKLIDVLFASSAFPGAFQQVKLKYRYKGKTYSHYFMDGGAYDNIPLQLAIDLDQRATHFFFIDPNNIRKEAPKSDEGKEEIPVGFLTTNLLPLFNTLEIYQSMKLYQTINRYFRKNSRYSLMLSSRYHPLTGKFLYHFGAFLDRNFREYDYSVGVYDAIYNLAASLKKQKHYQHISQQTLMKKLSKQLHLNKNPKIDSAYTMLLNTEFKHKKPKVHDKYSTIYRAFNLKKRDENRYGFKFGV